MQTRTIIIIGISILVLLALGIGAFFLFGMKGQVTETPANTNPFVFTPNGQQPQQTNKRVIYARGGTQVTVSDFAEGKTSTVIGQTVDDIQFDLTPYPEYVPGTPYPSHEFDVAFNQKTSEFIVTLNQEPLGHARIAAEAFLKSALGVTDKDLCALNVTITVPRTVNERFSAYANLGPSTCEGAAKLP